MSKQSFEYVICQKVFEFEPLFDDIHFEPGTDTAKFLSVLY